MEGCVGGMDAPRIETHEKTTCRKKQYVTKSPYQEPLQFWHHFRHK